MKILLLCLAVAMAAAAVLASGWMRGNELGQVFGFLALLFLFIVLVLRSRGNKSA